MATRVGYVGTEVSGDVLTAANFDKLPNGAVGYTAVTSNNGTLTTPATVAAYDLTFTIVASRMYRLTFIGHMQSSVADDVGSLQLYSGATQLWRHDFTGLGANIDRGLNVSVLINNPSAGSTTFGIQAGRGSGGTGTWQVSASASSPPGPGRLYLEELGPTF